MLPIVQTEERPENVISFTNFQHGLNTVLPAHEIMKTEMAECVNFKKDASGKDVSRPGIKLHTDTVCTGTPKFHAKMPIDGTQRELIVDSNYRLYYVNSDTPALIGTLVGNATVMAFNDIGLIMDGSYLKYIDGVASTNLKICYDAGEGYAVDYSSKSSVSYVELGNGTVDMVAQSFVRPNVSSSTYFFPPTVATFKLKRIGDGYTGTDNQPIYACVYYASNGAVLAHAVAILSRTAGEISTDETEYTVTFDLPDTTSYYYTDDAVPGLPGDGGWSYVGLNYGNGDGSHYIQVTTFSKVLNTDRPNYLAGISNGGLEFGDDCSSDRITVNAWDAQGSGASIAFDSDHYELTSNAPGSRFRFQMSLANGGELLRLSFDVKDGASAAGVKFRLYYNPLAKVYSESLTTAAGWATHYYDFYTEKGVVANYWGIEVETDMGGNNIEIKNVTLYERDASYVAGGYYKPLVCSLQPGLPPKGSFGAVLNNRAYVSGDPDNVSYVRHSGAKNVFDWSTGGDGGYVGAVNGSSNDFPVGSIITWLDELYVYGKETQPYFCKLTGSPGSYELPLLYQEHWATHKTVMNLVNDVWSANATGVDRLVGIQEYGDIRATDQAETVMDRIFDYWSTANTVAGYSPKDGQYLLSFPGSYHRVLVFHVGRATALPDDYPGINRIRYPAAEYEFYRYELTSSDYKWTASGSGTNEYYCELTAGGDPSLPDPDAIVMDSVLLTEGTAGSLADHEYDYGDNDTLGYSTVYFRDESGDPDASGITLKTVIVPTSFAVIDGELCFGASDKFIYTYDRDYDKDFNSIEVDPRYKTSFLEVPFGEITLDVFQTRIYSKGDLTCQVDLYKNDLESTPIKSWARTIYGSSSATQAPRWKNININARSLQFGLSNVLLTGGEPVYSSGILAKYTQE